MSALLEQHAIGVDGSTGTGTEDVTVTFGTTPANGNHVYFLYFARRNTPDAGFSTTLPSGVSWLTGFPIEGAADSFGRTLYGIARTDSPVDGATNGWTFTAASAVHKAILHAVEVSGFDSTPERATATGEGASATASTAGASYQDGDLGLFAPAVRGSASTSSVSSPYAIEQSVGVTSAGGRRITSTLVAAALSGSGTTDPDCTLSGSSDWVMCGVVVAAAPSGSPATVTPGVVAATASVPGPTAQAGAAVSPSVVAGTTTAPGPTAQGQAAASPDTVAGAVATPSPTAVGQAAASPDTVAGAVAVPGPTAQGAATTNPDVVAGISTVPTPTAGVAAGVSPDVVAALSAVPATTAQGGGNVSPDVVAALADAPTPVVEVGSGVIVAPDVVGVSVTVPTPVVSIPATVFPGAAAATVVVSDPTIAVPAQADPGVVATVVAMPQPTVAGGTAVTPGILLLTTTVPTPQILGVIIAISAKQRGRYFRGPDGDLVLVPLGRSVRRGYKTAEGWERVSSIFVFDNTPDSAGAFEQAETAIASVWATHSGSDAATLQAAMDAALQAAGFRAVGGGSLV